MHELSVAANLLKILEKIKKGQQGIHAFTAINITVNPYSCIDEGNINFIFASMVKGRDVYKKAEINIKRGEDPAAREFILDSVEMETYEEEA